MAENTIYNQVTLLSGNKVAFVSQDTANLARCIVYTPEGIIIRGALGLAASAMWSKYKDMGESILRHGWTELLQKLTIWSELEKQFPSEIPEKDLWYKLISDRDVENEVAGNACAERHKFYKVTNLTDTANRSRHDFVDGQYELILIFYHILNAGKLSSVKRIWEEGKEGSLAPKSYIQNLISWLR